MARPFLNVSQSDYLVQVVDTNSHWMTNSVDPDQLASEEADWSGSTLHAKMEHIWFSRTWVNSHYFRVMVMVKEIVKETAHHTPLMMIQMFQIETLNATRRNTAKSRLMNSRLSLVDSEVSLRYHICWKHGKCLGCREISTHNIGSQGVLFESCWRRNSAHDSLSQYGCINVERDIKHQGPIVQS